MNQFNRTVAKEIDKCCRIRINADILVRRGLALENVAAQSVSIYISCGGMMPISGWHRPAVALNSR